MIGIPGETTEDILKTLKLIRKLNPNYLQLAVYQPGGSTPLYSLLEEKKIINHQIDYFELIKNRYKPILNLENLSNETIRKLQRVINLSWIYNPSFLQKTIKSIIKNPFRFPNNIRYLLNYSFT